MAQLLTLPLYRITDANGNPLAGAKLYAYLTLTTTPTPVYTTAALNVEHQNPVVADGYGLLPAIFLDPAVTYRFKAKTSAGADITGMDFDPVSTADPGDIGFSQDGDYPAGSIGNHLQQFVCVTDAPFNAVGDGVTDDSAAFQDAIDAVSEGGGGVVYVPAGGVYILDAVTTEINGVIGNDYNGYLSWPDPQFGSTFKYAVEMKSNVTLIGYGATIKAADDISTDNAPQNFALFYSHQSLENLGFLGVNFDLNGENNLFSPNRAETGDALEDRYGRKHHAAIMFEGAEGRADDVIIRDCTFRNTAGISCIVAGRVAPDVRGDSTSGMGRRWRIVDCDFLNNGLDSYDHSSVFLWCDYAQVRGCNFYNDAVYAPTTADRTGMAAAIETHGAHTTVSANTIVNCRRGIFVSENGSQGYHAGPLGYVVSNVIVRDNIIRVAKFAGVDLFFGGVSGISAPHRISVLDNEIVMSGDDTNEAVTDYPSAINMQGDGVTISEVEYLEIIGNRATRDNSASGRSSHFFTFAMQAAGFKSITIENNESYGFTRAIYIVTDTNGTLDDLSISGNSWRNPLGGTVPAVTTAQKAGVFILAQGGTIGRLFLEDELIDTSPAVSATLDSTADTVTVTGHNYVAGDIVVFSVIATTTGISTFTTYYVVNVSGSTFKVESSIGGGAINLGTGNGTATLSVLKWGSGIAASESVATTVKEIHIGRGARFDTRLPMASRVVLPDLSSTRLTGVAVAGTLGAGAITAGTPATQAVTIPGVTANDTYELVGFSPATPDSFIAQARYSAANTAKLWVNSVTGTPDPGSTPFYIRVYPR